VYINEYFGYPIAIDNICMLACWVQNVVRVTVGCGISHKDAKYTIKYIGVFCLFHQSALA